MFPPFFVLHCYKQIATIPAFNSDYSVEKYYWNAFLQKHRKSSFWTMWKKNYKKKNIVHHQKRCSTGVLNCAKCTKLSSSSRVDLGLAKNIAQSESKNNHKCPPYSKDFPRFYSMRLNRKKFHGANGDSEAKRIDIEQMREDVDDDSLQQELETCKHFLV